ncbi:hypothetical protein BT96DRAFT_993899 [Gymnopus androsaceus JB14]|uniref:CCZ1/INTU/HSP4 first Longin domain-containing protein n=1 Tax=Gymnopus androsaceus JB14 TaxID=1447944 RepID=A0A6A4HS78_9AGAR|nr:hypothetical protein BT96DRAFT_993899 [Gymnopus androsaceus JB14]
MARIPPNLSYLTIYNPTLRPSVSTSDDEDAEEQAQILFYTSKERAVSRDRMLRQVGLAKALVNFSEMFNADDACQNVHSQSRRMIMVFPEPDFCIHAGVELAKTPRAPIKSKSKEKGVKSILKGKDKEPINPTFDYSDASVNNQALRASILRGYERFKLMHGSFTSILSTLGQEALELRLERFFTVWAWSWDIENGLEFSQHLGKLSLPTSLSQHLLTLVPPPPESLPPSPSTPSTIQDGTVRPKRPPDTNNEPKTNDNTSGSTFMGMGMPNMDVMDVGKWSWFNFAKNGKKSGDDSREQEDEKPSNEDRTEAETETTAPAPADEEETAFTNADVDQSALDDAMSSESIAPIDSGVKPQSEKTYFTTTELDNVSIVSGISIVTDTAHNSSASSSSRSPSLSPLPPPPRKFMTTTIHLAEEADPLDTKKRRIYYLTRHPFSVALIGVDEENLDPTVSVELLSIKIDGVLNSIAAVLDDEALKSSTDTIPSLTKILQPRDRHIFALERAPFAVHDDPQLFASNSIHLYNAQALLPEVRFRSRRNRIKLNNSRNRILFPANMTYRKCLPEVRAHNIGMLLGASARDRSDGDRELNGEVYMEVFRKDASLTDVDNVVTGVVRRMEEDSM